MPDHNDYFIDVNIISEMLYNRNDLIVEFTEAAVKSFSEFKENYSKFLLVRDEKEFRKAGHKIKPVAQMLKIEEIIEEYEHGKTLIWENKSESELKKSAQKIDRICEKVIVELKDIRRQHQSSS